MSDVPVAVAPATPKTPKKKSAAKPKKAATHPPTATMVNEAIKSLKDKKGSSLQAIKKYIAATYKVDADKLAPFIRKYVISATGSGKLILTKGKGAAGSFKLPAKEEKKMVARKPAKPKKSLTSAPARCPALAEFAKLEPMIRQYYKQYGLVLTFLRQREVDIMPPPLRLEQPPPVGGINAGDTTTPKKPKAAKSPKAKKVAKKPKAPKPKKPAVKKNPKKAAPKKK